MELVPGLNLRSYVGDEGVPWDRKLRWMLDAASALGAAHAAGLVHRDVKPDNVVSVRPDGRVTVLTDFGIARRVAGPRPGPPNLPPRQQPHRGRHHHPGTLPYMAPEQLGALPLDGRADQYA